MILFSSEKAKSEDDAAALLRIPASDALFQPFRESSELLRVKDILQLPAGVLPVVHGLCLSSSLHNHLITFYRTPPVNAAAELTGFQPMSSR